MPLIYIGALYWLSFYICVNLKYDKDYDYNTQYGLTLYPEYLNLNRIDKRIK